jgi:hypothetical protein
MGQTDESYTSAGTSLARVYAGRLLPSASFLNRALQVSHRAVPWEEGIHSEDDLWPCPHCDAELHADCVGEKCPACGTKLDDSEEDQ